MNAAEHFRAHADRLDRLALNTGTHAEYAGDPWVQQILESEYHDLKSRSNQMRQLATIQEAQTWP